MPFYEMDDVVDSSPEEVQETTVEPGQEQTAEPKKEEVPEKDPREVDETGKTSEVKEEEEPLKDYTANLGTKAGIMKAAENLAIALDEEVKFDDMTVDQIKTWYNKNRPRLGKEGFRGNRQKAKQYNETVKEDDKLARIESKLDKLTESQSPDKKDEPVKEEVGPPQKPKLDWRKYNELMLDDPDAAVEMMENYEAEQERYFEEKVKWEGEQLGKALKPLVERDRVRAEREKEASEKAEWGKAFESVGVLIEAEQGKDELTNCKPIMDQLIAENSDRYLAIADSAGKKRAVFELYSDAKRELELQELRKAKNGETKSQIDATKGAARNAQTTGGISQKQKGTMTETEAKEMSLRAVRGPETKYDIFD